MRVRTLIVLAAVTVPVAAAAVLLPDNAATMTPQAAGGRLLPGLKGKLAQAASLSIVGPDGTITLRRAPGASKPADGWGFADKGGYPVPAATVKPILEGLSALHGIEPKTERPKLFARLDLGDPGKGSEARLLTLSDASGTALGRIVLGKHKEDAGPGGVARIYARIPGTSQTWLAAPAITLPDETLDWIEHGVIDIDPDKIKQITLTPAGGAPLVLSRNKVGDKLDVQNVPKGGKLKSDSPGTDIASGFHTLELDDVEPAAKLAGSAVGTAHVDTFDGLNADLTFTKQNGQTWATVTATGTGASAKEAADITARTKGWAYQIADARVTTLQTKLTDLLEAPPKSVAPVVEKPKKK